MPPSPEEPADPAGAPDPTHRPDRSDGGPRTGRRHAGTAYVVAPDRGHGPGVLVLHSWWGLTPFFRGLADRLADEGFVAVVPDLMDGATADTPEDAEALLAATDPSSTAQLVVAAASTLHGLPVTDDGPIGVVGFSMGASWALWAAARAPELIGAVSAFYGTTDIDFAPVRAAVQGHFPEYDEFTTEDDLVEMEAHMRLVGLDVEVHRYPGATHWFMESDRPVAHSAGDADRAWARTIAFLRSHLGDERE